MMILAIFIAAPLLMAASYCAGFYIGQKNLMRYIEDNHAFLGAIRRYGKWAP